MYVKCPLSWDFGRSTSKGFTCCFLDPWGRVSAQLYHTPLQFLTHLVSYLSGSASMYDGTDLINDAGGDVVVVVVQYRLALFG